MKVLIYQVVGKPNDYSRVEYEVEGKTYEKYFSSVAIHSHYGGDGKIIYVCPQSLIEKIGCDIELIKNMESMKKLFKKKISEYVDGKAFDVLVVNSVGYYNIQNEKIYFDSTPGNISLQIFFDMISRLRKLNRDSEELTLIVDTSTGYNLYIPPLLESLKGVIIKDKLSNALKSKIKFKQAVSEPFRQNITTRLKVFINEYDPKAFFELPMIEHRLHTYMEDGEELKKEIYEQNKDLQKELDEVLCNLKIAFNAIKFNTPLALYTKKLINLSMNVEDLEDKLIEIYGNLLMPKVEEKVVKTIKLKEKDLFNLFYSLALYKWISREFKDEVEEPTTYKLREKFKEIYQKIRLPLNERFLDRDLGEIERLGNSITTEWRTMGEIKRKQKCLNENSEAKKQGDQKRNFFAHSGLEENVTMLMKKDGKIIKVKYREDQLHEVRKWLKKPE